MSVKVEWRSVLDRNGAQFAIIPGMLLMLWLSVGSSDSILKVN